MGVRHTGRLVTLIAVGAGVAGVITNAGTAWILTAGRVAVIRKIRWHNRSGLNGNLLVGFGDRTVAGSLFRQVLPNIWMINGIDDAIEEAFLPIAGNSVNGFQVDTTAVTGSIGNILVESTYATIAGGTPVEVIIEVEEF